MAKKTNKNFYFDFKLIDIKIKASKLNKNIILNEGGHEMNFEIISTHSFNFEQNLIQVEITVNVIDANSGENYVTFKVGNFFRANSLAEFKVDDEHIIIPDDYQYNLNVISLSNTRGIVFHALKKTPLKRIVLPLTDFKAKKGPVKIKIS